MRIILTIFFIIFIAHATWSQDIMLKELDSEISTSYQNTNSTAFKIQNFSNSEKFILIKQSSEKFQGGSTFNLCYDEKCNTNNEPFTIKIPANSESQEIKLVLNGGLSNFSTTAYLEFVDLTIDKTIKREILLKVSEGRSKDVFYDKGDVIVNSFFPNPAIKNAIMEYSISPHERDAKITLQNVLGNIIDTYELSPDETKLNISTENLNPGVYFYTLSINDEGLATRKLIVKK
jgi:hypothetical protein